jgi:endonuclease III
MPKRSRKTTDLPVKGGWDTLPHGLGSLQGQPSLQAQSVNEEGAALEASRTATLVGETTSKSERYDANASEASGKRWESAASRPLGSLSNVSARKAIPGPASTASSDAVVLPLAYTPRPRGPQKTARDGPDEQTFNEARFIESTAPRRSERIRSMRNRLAQDTTPRILAGEGPESDQPLNEENSSYQVQKISDQHESTKAHPTADGFRKPTHQTTGSSSALHLDDDESVMDQQPRKAKKARKTKDNPYGLTPGQTPFPEWQAPSSEQCEEVYQLLVDMHSDVNSQAPSVIPAPSLSVAGCGEVPCVLDALLRTILSGATTFDNADRMIKGLAEKFGVLEEGTGKGSIDWGRVRESPIEDVVDAIRVGGLGNNKANTIKAILEMVYQESVEKHLLRVEAPDPTEQPPLEMTDSQNTSGVRKTERTHLSLDHLHTFSVEEAMKAFTNYPGVGVKTAACVVLFCLRRPCFAVDTHVDKFARWLRWVPEKATVDEVFSHLEVRCPDRLKYGLHQLFIRHGKTCSRCRRSTVEGTEEWEASACPLEHLLDRFDKRRSKAKPKRGPRAADINKEVDGTVDTDRTQEFGGSGVREDDVSSQEKV